MSERGFLAMARGLLDHPVVGVDPRRPYSRTEAWQWMLLEAAFKSRRYQAGSIVLELKRGQFAHSTRYLAKAWRWSEPAVRRFLATLKTGAGTGAMIDARSDAGITVVTICNYERYQTAAVKVDAPIDAKIDALSDAEVTQERRRKEQLNKETKEEEPLRGTFVPTGSSEKQIYDFGKTLLGKTAGGMLTELRKMFDYDNVAVMDILRQAEEKSSPREWIAGVLKNTERPRTPEHILFPDDVYRGLLQ